MTQITGLQLSISFEPHKNTSRSNPEGFFFNQIGEILEFNYTTQKTTSLFNLVQELLGTPQREHVQHNHISN